MADIAFYGGSFDPPHIGHGLVASWLIWTRQVHEVWVVPTFSHPFEGTDKKGRLSPFALRSELCRAMVRDLGDPRIKFNGIECKLPKPSLTLQTLRALSGYYPCHNFRPVIGSDLVRQLDEWEGGEELKRDFPPIVVPRGNRKIDGLGFSEVSSTSIRAMLREAPARVKPLVTAEVYDMLTGAPGLHYTGSREAL